MDEMNLTPGTSDGHHARMGAHLARTIEIGKGTVPVSPEPLVCKPKAVEPWRVFKIMSEFVEGFELLSKYALAATIFGSTRTDAKDPYYSAAYELASRLAKKSFAIITGGSGGIMEAANKGAHDAGGASVGLNIILPHEQGTNGYLTDSGTFHHFFVRKTMLAFASEVYIFFPGGFGTLDEFFEIVTLVQTKKIQKIPILVYGKAYWEPLITLMRDGLLKKYSYIDGEDLNLFTLVDSVDEAYDFVVKNVKC